MVRSDVPIVVSAACGGLALAEMLSETWLGITTSGSPLAYRGTLIELPGAAGFALLLLVELTRASSHDLVQRERLALVTFAGSVLGLAVSMWAVVNMGLGSVTSWQYWIAATCLVTIFVFASFRSVSSPAALLRGFGTDAMTVVRQPVNWLLIGSCLSSGGKA